MNYRQKVFLSLMVIGFIFAGMKTYGAETKSDPLRLVLPEKIYAVPGHEINMYFDNIVLTPNINNYIFDVDCKYGRQDKTRWRYTPTDKDNASFPLNIKVLDGNNKILAQAQTNVFVAPKNAGKDKSFSLMMVGDSLTNATIYPREVHTLFKNPDNPKLKMVGSHCRGGRKPVKDGVAHEGYSGWTWSAFLTRWSDDPKKGYRMKSKFLRLGDDGKPVLDFQNYCNTYNDGKAPDYITVMLGTNDVYGANDQEIDKRIDAVFKNADTLVEEFQRVGPKTKIGLALIVPPASTQDAFGANYNCRQTRWQFRRNQHRLVERMIKKYGNRENKNIYLVPVYVNIDCVNNFPARTEPLNSRNPGKITRQSNGVHPATPGYLQIADSFYFWLKNMLSEKE